MSPAVRVFCIWFLLLAASVVAGCHTGPGVRPVKSPSLFAGWKASAFHDDQISSRTQQTLRQLHLAPRYEDEPYQVFTSLHKLAVKTPNPDVLFALAEISYALGRKLENQRKSEAIAFYYLCAGYSYHYIFDEPAGPLPLLTSVSLVSQHHPKEKVFDPRFRLACDLYNNGLAKCIRAAQQVGRLDPRHQLHLPTADGGKFNLMVTHHGFAWDPSEFGPLQFCSDFEVTGLQNHFRTYGLGVPLIGKRVASKTSAPGEAFYPKEVSFPVTAFFRFEGGVGDLGAMRAGRLELYNPLKIRKIKVQDRIVPLETDLTTPLAYFLNKTDLNGVEISGFFRADNMQDRAGVYMFEPYQPGKIPVLMVHGLLSSPLTWTSMFNELRADPVLNEKYQFWFYLYPTGNPYLATAADLRSKLGQLRAELDPQHKDDAFDQMVLVGHSMGGLVCRLMTQSSGDDYWRMISNQPFDHLKAGPNARNQLQQVFFFEPKEEIKRVIFLGTPHKGSNLSPSFAGRLLKKFVRFPKKLVAAADELMLKNPGLWKVPVSEQQFRRIPTSIDLLTPDSPALQLIAARPPPEGVRFHSIIGKYKGSGTNSHDGVVSYQSSHLDQCDSEVIVPSHHVSIHHHPLSILEVRRILHEHLKEANEIEPVVPAF